MAPKAGRDPEHLEAFLAEAQDADPTGWGVPTWRDIRDHASRGARLRCGIQAHGFARVRCTDCGHDRLLAFSCKGRGVCPSCSARRMAEVSAHLTDEVIPHLPVRQRVLSVPKRLRRFLPQTPEVASVVPAIVPGVFDHPGAVQYLHRIEGKAR